MKNQMVARTHTLTDSDPSEVSQPQSPNPAAGARYSVMRQCLSDGNPMAESERIH